MVSFAYFRLLSTIFNIKRWKIKTLVLVYFVVKKWEQPLIRCFVVSLWRSMRFRACFSHVVKSDFLKMALSYSAELVLDLCKDVKNLFAVYFLKKRKSFSPVSLRSKQLIWNWLAVGCCASWQPCLRASAFTCLCVAWLGMVEAWEEQRSWMRTAFIKGDDVEMESFQNLELPAG